jgi:hypothetical protein
MFVMNIIMEIHLEIIMIKNVQKMVLLQKKENIKKKLFLKKKKIKKKKKNINLNIN